MAETVDTEKLSEALDKQELLRAETRKPGRDALLAILPKIDQATRMKIVSELAKPRQDRRKMTRPDGERPEGQRRRPPRSDETWF